MRLDQQIDNANTKDYKVLARKYRPALFADLIGQEALVRTLSNAIRTNRIAHAFLLTGIRGVGKTTTARIIARALNCTGESKVKGETVEPCGRCDNCIAIKNDRHPDVIEMDAASRTGVGDIREIIESVKYLPNTAEYKIYIIDEVHMLSNSAFNALLKTLEEPPKHVKFIFATTEIRKIPVTIISRCQRFDLKRIGLEQLSSHLKNICDKEGAAIEDPALQLITKAAEGSVRDSLSLLDQAISYMDAGQPISEAIVRNMLGTNDKTVLFDLFEKTLGNQLPEALKQLSEMYDNGYDPVIILQDLLEITNIVTRTKICKEDSAHISLSHSEREQANRYAEQLSIQLLSRAWQVLLKGLQEVQHAPNAVMAAEMIIIRLAYLSNAPGPEELLKKIQHQSNSEASPSPAVLSKTPEPSQAPLLALDAQSGSETKTVQEQKNDVKPIDDFADLVELFRIKNEPMLYHALYNNVSLVSFSQDKSRVEICPDATVMPDLANRMADLLNQWTGKKWFVILSKNQGVPPLALQKEQQHQHEVERIKADPAVKSVLDHFPGADIISISESA